MGSATITPVHKQEGKKKLVRRSGSDSSQRIRRIVQWLFVALNGWLGIQFLLWVRFCERGGTGLSVPRPAGAEGWLPIAGLMNTKYLLLTGRVPAIHPAAMVLFIAFMLMSLLLKKAFCSWLCPVGTLSEHLWKLGRRVFGRNLHLPKWLDIPLRGLKVPASWLLCVPDRRHVRRGDPRFHVHTVRPGRRCQDAEFLPRYRANSGNRHRFAGSAVHADPELLVPVSLSVWSAAWNHVAAQSRKDPPRRRRLHRLRKVRASLSFRSSR